jgi:hypothetical protein
VRLAIKAKLRMFTLRMTTAMFARTLENSQYTTRLPPESRSFTLNTVRLLCVDSCRTRCVLGHSSSHSSPLEPQVKIKSRRLRRAGNVARMGEDRNVYKVLMGKPEGKSPLERPRYRWEDGIRMDLRETGWGSVEWIQLAQDRDRWRARWCTFGFSYLVS